MKKYPLAEDFIVGCDYVNSHLEWLVRQPSNFRSHEYKEQTHYQYCQWLYGLIEQNGNKKKSLHGYDGLQWTAFLNFWEDKWLKKNSSDVGDQIDKAMSTGNAEDNWAFITIGFNEQTVTVDKMVKVSDAVAHFRGFSNCDYVLEKHRENGIHHHTHFLVKLNQKWSPSKLAQDLFKIRGIRDIVLKKEFIDIKAPWNKKSICQPFDTYYGYVRGIKKSDKLQYVEKDEKWRNEHKIDHLFCV